MGIFKKLFRWLTTIEIGTKPGIDELIDSEDIAEGILRIYYDHILPLCDDGDSLDKLTEPQRVFFLTNCFEGEMICGGFQQFYSNIFGEFAHETVDALQAIKAHRTAEIVKKANRQFPDNVVPQDTKTRQDSMKRIESRSTTVWDYFDDKFKDSEEDLCLLNMEYIRRNRSRFVENIKG